LRDVTNLLVEGGPTLLASFFDAGLVDEAWIFTAPILIGGRRASSLIQGRGVPRIDAAVRPRAVKVQRVGPDVLHRLRFGA
jgi:diaminohydroxyphosphoribosylaminopyrimidine deaminase/5-amino-6-(5-phosphoribosylamino)uracil reductase